MSAFLLALQRRAELQSVALEDIAGRLQALQILAETAEPDVAKIHETLRDLVRVFESLAENAQAFMAGVARSIELQQAEPTAVANYKRRLIDYLQRFMGDLVERSDSIARRIVELTPRIDDLLRQVADREARDAAPGDADAEADARHQRCKHGGSAGQGFAVGFSARVTNRRRRICSARGLAPPFRSCSAPSPH